MDSKEVIGNRLKAARKKAGLTQGELGAQCGMSADWICSIERGHRRPEAGTMAKMGGVLGLTVQQIMGLAKVNGKYQPTSKKRKA